ncbi:PEP/pyruvate-binding domain-containing protein [Nocardiopsis protaetiae]|uniref:PEP/pyruvate-binding domain-containing protein n=3 Tax=Nocardiopsidaceae TaxID=83676 RepID=UPI00387A92C6
MRWVRPLDPATTEGPEGIGGKAHGLITLQRLGLPVPPGFVITTAACRDFRRRGRLPDGLEAEIDTALAALERETGRTLGGAPALTVSVRSGAAVSMPGMMTTVLALGAPAGPPSADLQPDDPPPPAVDPAAAGPGGDPAAASPSGRIPSADPWPVGPSFTDPHPRLAEPPSADPRSRPVDGGTPPGGAPLSAAGPVADPPAASAARPADFAAPPADAAARVADLRGELTAAVTEVFASWDVPRARTYRALHGIDDDAGTAVIVQAMVDGDRDDHSASGVAFGRDPVDGSPGPAGDVLFRSRGDAVVSGRGLPLPLSALADREPRAWADLEDALDRARAHYRDACYLEFTVESGRLWLLQVRPARFTGGAAVRTAVDLAERGVITRAEALARIAPADLERARLPVLAEGADLWTRGTAAGPGIAVGRIATDSATAVRLSARGPVVLVRPETSPADMAGIAAAAGVLTARGGAASHAAVVARTLGRPAVVGAADLHIEPGRVRAGDRWAAEGDLLTLDGTTGRVALGEHPTAPPLTDTAVETLLAWADAVSDAVSGAVAAAATDTDRLTAARRALGR